MGKFRAADEDDTRNNDSSEMAHGTLSLLAAVFNTFGAILLWQFDFDQLTKIAGLTTFLFVAVAAIVSAAYSVFKAQKTKDLQQRIEGLQDDKADLALKLAASKAESVLKDAKITRLERKLKDERKVTLSQAAKLEGVNVAEDHYDEDCDL